MSRLLRHALSCLFALSALTLMPRHGRAEQLQEFGDYIVYYNALTTAELADSVARQYGITRANNAGLLNIAVQKKGQGPLPQAVAAGLSGTATPLVGAAVPIRFREIREDDGTVYYLGEFAIAARGNYRIVLAVTPNGRQQPYELKFSKEYVGD